MVAYRLIRIDGGPLAREFETQDDHVAAGKARSLAREHLDAGFGAGPPVGFELQRREGEPWVTWQVCVRR
ncbi:hypothetical protein [uncultured Modestobacter sp.]|uniref:hypothetical protein n=1 Tax=uncultured Modestobacter sp. TaxID=380048 RepID=UPI0026235D63|nr:hypothetical protein [uncultured Modestobacter sp.]